MIKWARQFSNASNDTKWFVITAILFGAMLVVSTIYCYARIEFAHKTEHHEKT